MEELEAVAQARAELIVAVDQLKAAMAPFENRYPSLFENKTPSVSQRLKISADLLALLERAKCGDSVDPQAPTNNERKG